MPNITLNFKSEINSAAQIGDTIYFCPTTTNAEFITSSSIVRIGTIKRIKKDSNNKWGIICGYTANANLPSNGDFIMFGKNSEVNTASALGYYAEVRFVNNSTEKSELFATACGVFESSK